MGFELVRAECRKYKDVKLPERATEHSAGYDIYMPCNVLIEPNKGCVVWTDIKCKMKPSEVLMLYVRSSVGIKKHIMLMNNTGIIDSDYYGNPDNDGNISIPLWNYGNATVTIGKGERIAQALLMNYKTFGEKVETKRVGGTGSTNEHDGRD